MRRTVVAGPVDGTKGRTLVLELDPFTSEALLKQSAELAVSVEELVAFSVLYYLADRDSQRISRRLPAGLRSSSAN
jgi:hypothetical protein